MPKCTQYNRQCAPPVKLNLFGRLNQYLLNYVSDVFEWPQSKKAQFINAISALICISQISVIYILLQFDLPKQHALHPIIHQYGIEYLFFSFCLYASMFMCGQFLRHTHPKIQAIYSFLSLLAYGVGAVIITYLLGPLSIATGVTLTMSPLVGLILFSNRLIAIVAICVFPIGTTCFILVAIGKIPYTILIESTQSMHQNISLLALMYGTGLPFLLLTLFIAYACIERWKQRELIVQTLSTTDSLTSLANRGVFLDEIESYLSRPRMHRKALSVLMMDLDDFKQINDRFGHLVGDDVLKNIAQTLQFITREEDLVARYGGEEFCILLPNTNRETAEAIAKRILTAVTETTTRKDNRTINVTTSIGLTTADAQQLNSGKVTVDMLLGAIDAGMYTSKTLGKNTLYFNPLPI